MSNKLKLKLIGFLSLFFFNLILLATSQSLWSSEEFSHEAKTKEYIKSLKKQDHRVHLGLPKDPYQSK